MGTDLLALGLVNAFDTRVVEVSRGAVLRAGSNHRSGDTVLDLAGEAGWFDELVDEAFAPGGLRT